MVIRYTCEKCTSVLKISDDLAGTDGKCPKCKAKFKVPAPTPGADEAENEAQSDSPGGGAESARTAEAEIAETVAQLVDMPTEVTPQVDLSAIDDFDPVPGPEADNSAMGQAGGSSAPEAPKPSVAELMRAHEEAKKKKAAVKKKDKGSLEAAAAAADVMTAGTAASALTRTYDKKRSGGSDTPTLTREERRQAEQRDAVITYAKKAVPALVVTLVFGYFLFRWAFATPLPDLEYVTGVVTRANAPLVGVVVQFAPLAPTGGAPLENATPSIGITDEDGKYVLKYDPDNDGVLPGNHEISISTISGAVYPMAAQDQKKTVSSDSTTFNFNL